MIDDFEYYRNKLKKPDRYLSYPYRPQLFSNSAFEGNDGDYVTRQTFAAVTVIKDGVLTITWKVEEE